MSSQRRHVKAQKASPAKKTNANYSQDEPSTIGQSLMQKFDLLASHVENSLMSHGSRLAEWEKIGLEIKLETAEDGTTTVASVAGLPDLVAQVRDTMRDTREAVSTARQCVFEELYEIRATEATVMREMERAIDGQRANIASQDKIIAKSEALIKLLKKQRDDAESAGAELMSRERAARTLLQDEVKKRLKFEVQSAAQDKIATGLSGQLKSLRTDFDKQRKERVADRKELAELRARCRQQEDRISSLREGRDVCAICFEEGPIRVMKPCGHTACDGCITPLKMCPFCRVPVLSSVLLHPSPLSDG